MSPVQRAARALAATGATLVLAACGSTGTGEPGGSDDPPGEEQTVSPVPSRPSDVPGAGSDVARQAVADLSRRLDVTADDVTVARVEAVTWSDGSLGCAEKGMAYTQALVEGTRITLQVAGRSFEYHAAGGRSPFLCENPTQ